VFHVLCCNAISFPKNSVVLWCIKYIIKAVPTLDVLAEIPSMLNYGKRLEHGCAKQVVTYLYFITIGNCQKAFIWIPFTVKHIMKMFMLQIKEQIQILIGNNIFFKNEIDLVGYFRCIDYEIRSRNKMTPCKVIYWKRCDNLGQSLHFVRSLH